MRQKTQTPDDAKLRTALENMRYAACTEEDIVFLRTRIAGDREDHPHLNTQLFRNVSIITAWNIQRDLINDEGAKRFAADTNQDLVEFYSVDKLSARAVDKGRWEKCEQAHFKRLGPRLQQSLWQAAASCNTEHLAGCLKLCVGMPVMIKANEATELCITRGQEAVIVGWDSSIGPSGQNILDTLFVELVKPPKDVQLQDLPLNVVPLSRTSEHVTALLKDDSLLSLTREQVMVLHNFAMTDYASQGKSRLLNVVHLNNLKDHKAYYVALSRGHRADGTVIVQGFESGKITGKLHGFLRQEFRELEILDEITRKRAEGVLPKWVCGIYRRQLIASYRKWKGSSADPDHFHPALKWASEEDDVFDGNYTEWRPTKPKPSLKRKAPEPSKETPPNKKRALATSPDKTPSSAGPSSGAATRLNLGPMGLIWDNRDWSCGYDSLLTPLATLLIDDPALWTQRLADISAFLGLWAIKFQERPSQPEIARDALRTLLHFNNANAFPLGPNPLALDELCMAVTSRKSYGTAVTSCPRCGYRVPGTTETFAEFIDATPSHRLNTMYPESVSTTQWLGFHLDRVVGRCRYCPAPDNNMRRVTTIEEIPNLLMVTVNMDNLVPNEAFTLQLPDGPVRLRLRGVIFHSARGRHFTSATVDKTGKVWYHDGIRTGRTCRAMGLVSDAAVRASLNRVGEDEKLGAVIYARE
ncbi:hypothetical protein C8R43DRAFT_876954 [Mycena crocata]|nr:hypothetical protein C8R43DRAFT_876954 [Mycena crocata]